MLHPTERAFSSASADSMSSFSCSLHTDPPDAPAGAASPVAAAVPGTSPEKIGAAQQSLPHGRGHPMHPIDAM